MHAPMLRMYFSSQLDEVNLIVLYGPLGPRPVPSVINFWKLIG